MFIERILKLLLLAACVPVVFAYIILVFGALVVGLVRLAVFRGRRLFVEERDDDPDLDEIDDMTALVVLSLFWPLTLVAPFDPPPERVRSAPRPPPDRDCS